MWLEIPPSRGQGNSDLSRESRALSRSFVHRKWYYGVPKSYRTNLLFFAGNKGNALIKPEVGILVKISFTYKN